MGALGFSAWFLAFSVILNSCMLLEVAGDDDPVMRTDREAIEIIIGGGGEGSSSPAPAPENQDCPPPPPPPPPPNARLERAYKAIQKFKTNIPSECDCNGYLKTWDEKSKNVCKYRGFFCAQYPGTKDQAVAGVDFNGAGFCGKYGQLPLDGFIDELKEITIFHANSNNFTGTVTRGISKKLPYLYELDLSNNQLSGDFPMEVLDAKNLTFLDLRFNKLKGVVPSGAFNLDVDILFINNNNLEQGLPDNLGDTPALYLTFANNKFTGQIPSSIGRARNLLEVLFLNNKLEGCLPYEIGYLQKATVFDVGFNRLTGPIPHSFGCLKKMELLNLAGNEFYGAVPESVCKLPNLANFTLSYNYFTQVGPECRKLIQAKKLDVKMNCILDLPNQRWAAECKQFFSKPKYCGKEEQFKWVPCQNYYGSNSTEKSTTAAAPKAISYGTLTP